MIIERKIRTSNADIVFLMSLVFKVAELCPNPLIHECFFNMKNIIYKKSRKCYNRRCFTGDRK